MLQILNRSLKLSEITSVKCTAQTSLQVDTKRLMSARTHILATKECNRMLFFDEGWLNLDVPDGKSYYFYDLTKHDVLLSRNNMGDIMIWAL